MAVHKLSPERKLLSLSAFGYDGRGNKICQIDKILFQDEVCGDHTIHTMFDSMGQKISEIEQHDKTTSYTFQNGKLYQIIKPDQIILTHHYDGLGRLKELISTDGTVHYLYSYDLNDNLTKIEDLILNFKIERSYDFMNRLIVEKQLSGSEIHYTYDAQDRIKEVLFQDEKIVYTYNPTEVVSASRYRNDNLLYTFSQQTDWRGKITHHVLPGNLNLSCKWDALGQCKKIESVPFQQTFTYDSGNNLIATKVNDSLGSYESNFSYNDLNQIREEKGLFNNSYAFDSLNNRRNRNAAIYAVNELNQLLSESAHQYTYDKNGNRTSKDSISYSYDALNRLTRLSVDGKTIEYKYDSFGRRLETKTAEETIHYLYQFDTEIAALKNSQIVEFKAIYEPFSPFAIELKGEIYTPIRNHRGDFCQLIDLKGNSVSNYRYDAFGQFLFRGKVKSPWTLSGQRYDGETKLYRFLHRDYDSFTGRWLTSDPLGFADGPNLYAYVNNNPWIYTDQYGLFASSVYESVQETVSSAWNSPRVQGTCQMFTGAAEMGAGGAIAYGTYGAAAPLGFSVAAHGADHFCTGLRSVVSGRHTETVTSQLLQKTGISKETAHFVDNGISMIGTLGGSAAVRSSQAAAFPKYSLPPAGTVPGIACNRAVFERYKTSLRTNMEKPYVVDAQLSKMVEKNYRPNARIGNGSTAAAIRQELLTGEQVSNKFHSIKGENSISFFENWLKNNPTCGQGDRAAAENIIKDIRNALGE